MEDEIQQNNRRITSLQEAKDFKDQQINETHQKIAKEQLVIGQLRNQNAGLDKDIQHFENVNHKHQQ